MTVPTALLVQETLYPDLSGLPDNVPLQVFSKESYPDEEEEELDLSWSEKEEEGGKRGNWGNKAEFILSLLGYAVGLSNIWRFPYLCYRNGGGAFLIPYWFFMIIAGVPLFFMEASLGQFCSKSAISMWSIAPILKGTGYATVIVTVIIAIYYNVIMSYVVFFFVNSFTSGQLPWASCTNWWNTPQCLDYSNATLMELHNQYRDFVSSGRNVSHPGAEHADYFGNLTYRSPSDEYFHNRVLQISSGLDEPGNLRWELVFCLIPVWAVTGLCLIKGVKSVGKVVYFTATFPYLMLAILLIRGLTLPGAMKGIAFYILPDFSRLADPKVWCDAVFQVFFSLGPGWGSLITMGSYNKFNNDCYKDGILVPILMGLTSLFAGFVVFSTVGFMSEVVGRPVGEVVEQGPGLAFIMYPEVVTKLPLSQLWSVLFFFMLFIVGLDTMFVMLETAIAVICDELPERYKINRTWIMLFSCIFMCVLGLPCITEGGMYLFQLIDTYSATYTVIFVCILEVICISWIYGAERFLDDIKFMIGYHPPFYFWSILWRFFTTGIVLIIFAVAILQYQPLDSYNGYKYPDWALNLGWVFCLVSFLWIPCWAIGWFLMAEGSFLERLRSGLFPNQNWGPAKQSDRMSWKMVQKMKPYGRNFMYRLRHYESLEVTTHPFI